MLETIPIPLFLHPEYTTPGTTSRSGYRAIQQQLIRTSSFFRPRIFRSASALEPPTGSIGKHEAKRVQPSLPSLHSTALRCNTSSLEPHTQIMDAIRLNPRIAGTRERQIQDAKNMQKIVDDRLTKKALTPPAYEFLELIGKGAYGRVYKR